MAMLARTLLVYFVLLALIHCITALTDKVTLCIWLGALI